MYLTNESEHEYRFGDNGPKYLTNGPFIDMGVVIIQAGQDFDTHKHTKQEESFLVLEGECDVYVDGKLVKLKKGDYLRCDPDEAHYFKNTSNAEFKAVFIKAIHSDIKDSVYIDWKPDREFIK